MIKQRIIENEVYTINILKELTSDDKIDLEKVLKHYKNTKTKA